MLFNSSFVIAGLVASWSLVALAANVQSPAVQKRATAEHIKTACNTTCSKQNKQDLRECLQLFCGGTKTCQDNDCVDPTDPADPEGSVIDKSNKCEVACQKVADELYTKCSKNCE